MGPSLVGRIYEMPYGLQSGRVVADRPANKPKSVAGLRSGATLVRMERWPSVSGQWNKRWGTDCMGPPHEHVGFFFFFFGML
ncbi:hypothetical protein RSAG8_02258, partial [Rhizoctonia solani AG-8 WAC10335]